MDGLKGRFGQAVWNTRLQDLKHEDLIRSLIEGGAGAAICDIGLGSIPEGALAWLQQEMQEVVDLLTSSAPKELPPREAGSPTGDGRDRCPECGQQLQPERIAP